MNLAGVKFKEANKGKHIKSIEHIEGDRKK